MNKFTILIAFLGAFPSVLPAAFAQNLIDNNSFETACEGLKSVYGRVQGAEDFNEMVPPWLFWKKRLNR